MRCQAYRAQLADKQELSTDSDVGEDKKLESDSAIDTDESREGSAVPMFGPAILAAHASEPVREFSMHIDVAGDFYGDYEDYTMGDFGLEDGGDDEEMGDTGEVGAYSDSEGGSDAEEEVDDVDVDAMVAADEVGLEPERPGSEQLGGTGQEDEDRRTNDGPAVQLRGGEEEPLKNQPFIVQFPGNSAGAVHSQHGVDQNTQYSAAVGGEDRHFAPFSSQMEWEIARWAKLRGPSSTAFNELMAIEGVSCFFFI